MQRPARPASFPFGIQLIGNRKGIGICFEHAVQRRTTAIDRFDPRQVLLGERPRGFAPGLHLLLQVGDGGLFEIEGLLAGRLGDRDAGRQEDGNGEKRSVGHVDDDSRAEDLTRRRDRLFQEGFDVGRGPGSRRPGHFFPTREDRHRRDRLDAEALTEVR